MKQLLRNNLAERRALLFLDHFEKIDKRQQIFSEISKTTRCGLYADAQKRYSEQERKTTRAEGQYSSMYFYNIGETTLRNIHENKTLILIEPSYTRVFSKTKPETNEISQYFIYSKKQDETTEGTNFRKFAKTDYFLYKFVQSQQPDKYAFDAFKTPLVKDFATGEIVDKPDVFLNFDTPEILDEQLSEIYGLTVEDRDLMNSIAGLWKSKLLLSV